MSSGAAFADLRLRVARLERRPGAPSRGVVRLRIPAIDRALPGGGFALGALHEVAGSGPEVEHGAAAALFAAALLARTRGPILWVLAEPDLFTPALAAVGLSPRRVLHVEAGAAVLLAMEEGLRHPGLAAVVGEIPGRLGLTASRRLHLAAEATGALALALRRSRRFNDPALAEPSAALTSWRVASAPSAPPLPESPATPGLGPARWRLDLVRVRGGEPASWTVEADHASGRLALAADLADRPAAPAEPHRAVL
ncbi:MAG TPA: damage-inducible protein [Acetobacteraceae bacterium]|nr:damage-inducible protein [Acetobacteraceae bacterium]